MKLIDTETLKGWAEHECQVSGGYPCDHQRQNHSERRNLASALLASHEALDQEKYFRDLDAERAETRISKLEAVLQRIARWHGEFPRVPARDGREECSYGVAYGSNGERDFMRQLALEALATRSSEGTKR